MVDIKIADVAKTFQTRNGPVTALSEVSLAIKSGQFVCILGPSGCGKSTLLSMIAGLATPTSGSISIAGREVHEPQTDLGFVFQDHLLLDWRDALGNVMLQVEGKRLPRAEYVERARDLLQKVGLAGFENKRPWELSGGMKQRVALCRALIHQPSLLLMDEPFGPLDALTREQLMLDLHRLWLQERQTVVFVTHSITEAVFLGETIAVMTDRPGRIHEVVHTTELEPERALEMQASPVFQQYTGHIYGVFSELGVLRQGASPVAPKAKPLANRK